MAHHTPTKVGRVVDELRPMLNELAGEDGQLPSEDYLRTRFGVSRQTIREALITLGHERRVFCKHGVGWFINFRVIDITTRLDELWDVPDLIKAAGYNPDFQHIADGTIDGEPPASQALNMYDGEQMLRTSNMYLADGVPAVYGIKTLRTALICSAYERAELRGPMCGFLLRHCNQRVEYNVSDVSLVEAGEVVSALLNCSPNARLFRLVGVSYNYRSEPLLHSEEYYHPEYFTFSVVRHMTRLSSSSDGVNE